MVLFALTRKGFEELRGHTAQVPSPLWVADGVLTDAELEKLRGAGVEVSSFNHAIDPSDTAAIEGALDTIAQHHPGQSIWVERNT